MRITVCVSLDRSDVTKSTSMNSSESLDISIVIITCSFPTVLQRDIPSVCEGDKDVRAITYGLQCVKNQTANIERAEPTSGNRLFVFKSIKKRRFTR